MNYKVVFGKVFLRRLKKLKRRYPHINDDIKAAVRLLQQRPQTGRVIPKSGGMRKLRIRSTDQSKGGQGGYRLIYQVIAQPESMIVLLYVYAKSQKSNVPTQFLHLLRDDLERAVVNSSEDL